MINSEIRITIVQAQRSGRLRSRRGRLLMGDPLLYLENGAMTSHTSDDVYPQQVPQLALSAPPKHWQAWKVSLWPCSCGSTSLDLLEPMLAQTASAQTMLPHCQSRSGARLENSQEDRPSAASAG